MANIYQKVVKWHPHTFLKDVTGVMCCVAFSITLLLPISSISSLFPGQSGLIMPLIGTVSLFAHMGTLAKCSKWTSCAINPLENSFGSQHSFHCYQASRTAGDDRRAHLLAATEIEDAVNGWKDGKRGASYYGSGSNNYTVYPKQTGTVHKCIQVHSPFGSQGEPFQVTTELLDDHIYAKKLMRQVESGDN